jgi:hypothetical protein
MEIAYSTSTVRTPVYLGPDAHSYDVEIACWRLTIRTAISLSLDVRSLIWKLLAADVRPSRRLCLTFWTWFSNKKDFSAKISESLVAEFSVRTALVHRPDGTRMFHCSLPFEPQPTNRGPWALRIARIRYWIPSELRELFCEVIGADLFSPKPLQVCCCCATIEVYLRGRL